MLVRLLILSIAILFASLFLRLHCCCTGVPPWLSFAHNAMFLGALIYVAAFASIFIALHVFGYRL